MKIFQLLHCLSKQELKLLRKAVLSPLFNTNEQVVKLFDLLNKQHPNFDDSLAAKRKLFKKLFPKKGFSEPKLRQLFSQLTKIIEQFLIHLEQQTQPLAQQQRLASIYNKRGLYSLYKKETAAVNRQLTQQETYSVNHHQQQFELWSMQYFHPAYNKYQLGDNKLNEVHGQLDIYYAIHKLRLVLASKSRAQVLQETPHLEFVDYLKAAQKNGFQQENILLNLYLQALALFEDTPDFEFPTFEAQLFQYLPQFDLEDQQFLYTAGLNYTIKQKNRDVSSFQSATFRWLQFGITTKLVIINNTITDAIFANIIVSACHEKAYDWVNQFISNYQMYLPEKDRVEAIQYYKSFIYYTQRDWDKTLDCFFRNGYQADYQPRIRVLIIRALFEKFLIDKENHWELLTSNLHAFDQYLRRNKEYVPEKLLPYQNFIKLIRQLAKRVYARERAVHIKTWFAAKAPLHQPLIAKSWLSDKVAML